MQISVAIPTRNRLADLKECLDTLRVQTHPPDELIIVDNSTNDEIEQYIKDWKGSAKFKCIYIKQTWGSIPSLRNTAIDNSNGDVVFFFDDDVVLDRDYIRTVTEIFVGDVNKEIGGITGLGGCDLKDIGTLGLGIPAEAKDIINSGGDLGQRLRALVLERYGKNIFEQSIATHLLWRIIKWVRDIATTIFLMESPRKGKIIVSGFRSDFPRLPQSVPFVRIDTLPGYNMSFRKEVLDTFRFDKNLELFPNANGEDQEFCMRVGKKYKLVATSRAKCIHKRSPSARLDPSGQFASIVANYHYIVKKNMNHPINLACFWWAVSGVLLSRIVRLVFTPSKESWLSLVGTTRGINLALKGKAEPIRDT